MSVANFMKSGNAKCLERNYSVHSGWRDFLLEYDMNLYSNLLKLESLFKLLRTILKFFKT